MVNLYASFIITLHGISQVVASLWPRSLIVLGMLIFDQYLKSDRLYLIHFKYIDTNFNVLLIYRY